MSVVRIAHLSDPHFGTTVPAVLDCLLSSVKKLNPDVLLFTGDMTQRARRSQFREARDFIYKLSPIPALVLPGNHDIPLWNIPARLFYPYSGFKEFLGNQSGAHFLKNNVLITTFNSTSRWRHIQGRLDLFQLISRIREQKAGTNVHLVALHHPLDCRKNLDNKNLLKNRQTVMECFSDNRVDMVMSGHIHDPSITLSKTRYPEVSNNFIIGVSGTCASWRIRPDAPNSFHFIEINAQK